MDTALVGVDSYNTNEQDSYNSLLRSLLKVINNK